MGQTEKNSAQAHAFRFALELGHLSMRSTWLRRPAPDIEAREARRCPACGDGKKSLVPVPRCTLCGHRDYVISYIRVFYFVPTGAPQEACRGPGRRAPSYTRRRCRGPVWQAPSCEEARKATSVLSRKFADKVARVSDCPRRRRKGLADDAREEGD